MLSIQTNVTSLFAQQALSQNQAFESKTIQQLTSGYRINSSGDDAAGLAVANQYRANVAQLQQGVLNASNASTTLQIIDGGLNNISQILDRLQTLATESASGTFSGNRATLDSEFQTLLTEINRQAANIGLASGGSATGSSKYNTTALQTFIGGGDTQADSAITVDLTNGTVGITGVDVAGLGLTGTSVSAGGATPTTNAAAALTAITTAIGNLGTMQGAVGGGENLLNYATSLANSQITNLSSAQASIRDADVASAAANLTKAQTLQQSSIAALAQANAMPAAVLKLLQ
jgi:flagellin